MDVFIVTFRETLEAAIIIGLIFSMLGVFKVERYKKRIITIGIVLGVVLSFIFAFCFEYFFGGFEGKAEKIYEGTLMLLACGMITQFLVWTNTNFHNIGKNIKKTIKYSVTRGQLWMLSLLTSASVLREGIETVIFLQAFDFSFQSFDLVLALSGIIFAIFLAYIIFFTLQKINIRKVLFSTNILFVLIAAGLLSHAIVEFQSAGFLSFGNTQFYDISYILSEKEGIGSILKAALSYDANPTVLSFFSYIFYIITSGYYMFLKKK